MNKTLYYFGIALLALSMAVSVTHSILLLSVGGVLFTLGAFKNWLMISSAISFSASVVLLKYAHFKKYTVLFWTGVVSLLANVSMQIALWQLFSGQREFLQVYIASSFAVLIAGIVNSLSLIFSSASGKVWLRRAGIFLLLHCCAMLVLVSITVFSSDMQLKFKLQNIIEWTSLLTGLFPLMLLLNFREEIREEKLDFRGPEYQPGLLGGVSLVAFSLALVFGFSLATEGKTHLYWKTKNAEAAAKFVEMGEERTFENSRGEKLKYALIKPAAYDPDTKYPLVVALPYAGYEASAAQVLASGSNRDKYPAFLLVPYCPDGAGWGGIPDYPTIDTLVFDAIIELEKEMSIDVSRRYVTGVSRGGYGSWHFITTRPDMFAAAIPVCGGGNPQLASRIANVSVWAFHGALDQNVPVSGSRDMIAAMKNAGANPKYTEFEDKAHNIWYEVSQTADLWDWLFEQKRVPSN